MKLTLLLAAIAIIAAPSRGITWTNSTPAGELTLTCDEQDAPPGAASNAAACLFAEYPRIAEMLGVPADRLVRQLSLRFVTNLPPNVPANTAGAKMNIAVRHATEHADDLRGMMIHEWTHTVQAYSNPNPSWITEGLADAVRLRLSAPDDAWRRRIESTPRAQTDYHHGYGEAARFLLWIRDQGQPSLMPDLNTAMRERTYGDAWWRDHTGRELADWWKLYRDGAAGR